MSAIDFYNTELSRLQQKQANASDILNSQQRIAMLNDSYRKRYAKYVQMLIVLVLAVVVYLGLNAVKNMFPIIPQFAVDLLTFLLMGLVFFYLAFAFYELYSRDVLNYDELDIPVYDASGSTTTTSAASTSISASTNAQGTCVGQACCPTDYVWNVGTNKCIPKTATPSAGGFTTLEFTSIDSAYTDLAFDSPTLIRGPVSNPVNVQVDTTSLNFSKI
jgi:hypothetical protein